MDTRWNSPLLPLLEKDKDVDNKLFVLKFHYILMKYFENPRQLISLVFFTMCLQDGNSALFSPFIPSDSHNETKHEHCLFCQLNQSCILPLMFLRGKSSPYVTLEFVI